MSGSGSPDLDVDASGLRVAVVAAQWHQQVMDGLVAGAQRGLSACGVSDPLLVRVPGSFELPVAAARLARDGWHAVVVLGVVLRGATPHFDYICQAATAGLTQVAVDTGVPVGFGVLTCDDQQQALDRAGLPGSTEDKGFDAAVAAVATAVTLRGVSPGQRGRARDDGASATMARVKTFDALFAELSDKAMARAAGSATVTALDSGVHAIGKKVVEEAAEVWMAAEHESAERTAEEVAQLLYHLQVLMLARGLSLPDVYAHL